MENKIIKGIITATSNKQSEDFKSEFPTKTAYITPHSPQDIEALTNFGCTLYSSTNENTGEKEEFFIIKCAKNVALYNANSIDGRPSSISGGTDTPNFRTTPDYALELNIIKGEKLGREFFRLQAINCKTGSDVEEIEQANPFA